MLIYNKRGTVKGQAVKGELIKRGQAFTKGKKARQKRRSSVETFRRNVTENKGNSRSKNLCLAKGLIVLCT